MCADLALASQVEFGTDENERERLQGDKILGRERWNEYECARYLRPLCDKSALGAFQLLEVKKLGLNCVIVSILVVVQDRQAMTPT